MTRFDYLRATAVDEAVRAVADDPTARFLAGGTNLVDLIKYGVERPGRLVDIGRLPLDRIEESAEGGLRIGALVTNEALAADARIAAGFPLVASALLAGASPQLRNAATTGGNLLQRTRCHYFYDRLTPCNKRAPGSGCPALDGLHRMHAILGGSAHCIATHPSDLCVALAALAATVHVTGARGARTIALADFHRLPGDRPEIDTNLARDELILAVELPAASRGFAARHSYLKLRDRLSYAFALVAVAAALRVENGAIAEARLALGGVAHKPWRDETAEALLVGEPPGAAAFARAADRVLEPAVGRPRNAFKIELARRAMIRALTQAAAATPQSQIDKRVA